MEGNVDTKKAGTYEVTYSIPEEHWCKSSSVEGVHSATAKIVVSEEDTETEGLGPTQTIQEVLIKVVYLIMVYF